MSYTRTRLKLAVVACGVLLSASGSVQADPAAPPAQARLPLPARWTETPEAVHTAAAALRGACTAWLQTVDVDPSPISTTPYVPKPAEAESCEMIRDPQGDHFMYMGFGALAAAALLGAAVGTYATVATLLRLLASGVVTMLDAVRDRRSSHRRSWPR